MVTTRRGTNTTSEATATETFHPPHAVNKGATPGGKKRTAKRTKAEAESTKKDNDGKEPPKKKVKLELPEKAEKEKEPNNTGQCDLLALRTQSHL